MATSQVMYFFVSGNFNLTRAEPVSEVTFDLGFHVFFLIFNWIAGGDVVKQTSLLRSGGPNDDSSHPTGVQEGCWKAQCQIKGSYRQFKVKPKSRRLRRIQAAPSSSFQEFPWVSYCFFWPLSWERHVLSTLYMVVVFCAFFGGGHVPKNRRFQTTVSRIVNCHPFPFGLPQPY